MSKLLLSKISTNIKSNTKCKCKVKYVLINKISTIVKLSLPSLSSPLSLSTTTRTFLIITFDCCVGIIKERLGVRGIVDSVSRCPLPSPSPSPSAPSYSLLLIVSLVSSKSAREAEASLTACSDARSLLLGGVPHREESLARNPSQVVSCSQ